HPEVEVNLAALRRKNNPDLQRSRLLCSTEALEPSAGLLVELVAEASRSCFRLRRRLEVTEEGLGRELRDLPPRGFEHRTIGRHEQHSFTLAMLRCEPLEQRVRIRRVPNFERPEPLVLARAVEHNDASRARVRDERRE